MNQTYGKNKKSAQDEIDLKGILFRLLQYWYLFVIFLIIFCGLATVYLRYSHPVYSVGGTILIRDKSNSVGAENLIESLELFKSNKNLENEKGILQSYQMINRAVESLDLGVAYFSEGRIKTIEQYKNSAYKINVDSLHSQMIGPRFLVKIIDDSTFQLKVNGTNFETYTPYNEHIGKHKNEVYSYNEKHQFGDTITTKFFSFQVVKNNQSLIDYRRSFEGQDFFLFKKKSDIVNSYRNRLSINQHSKYSSILDINLKGAVYQKDIELINQLMTEYIEASLEDKNRIATNTINFINTQLDKVSSELFGIEERLKDFREENKFLDLKFTSNAAFEKLDKLEMEKSELLVKDKYYTYLMNYVQQNTDMSEIIAPSAMGIDDPLLLSLINNINRYYSERAVNEFSVEKDNPTLVITNKKIQNAREILIENVKVIKDNSKIAIGDIEGRIEEIENSLKDLPVTERDYVSIKRLFNLNEHIYNYLMEKRSEAEIAKASTIADHKIVDDARLLSKYPISPNRKLTYILAIAASILVSVFAISLITIFNDKVNDLTDLKNNANVPVFGSIWHKNISSNLPVVDTPRSIITEAFQSIRVNLKYAGVEKNIQTIGITSTTSQEGKTFTAMNLAASLASNESSVILIGADLRKPKLGGELGIENNVGLSNYLIGKGTLDEIIGHSVIPGVDVITSGPIPPNPIDLLESTRMNDLISELRKKYHYVILDCPPVGLVADYTVVQKHTDITLYLVRAKFTKLEMLDSVNELYKENKNMYLILNDRRSSGRGYDYSYYEYVETDTGFFQKLFNIFKRRK